MIGAIGFMISMMNIAIRYVSLLAIFAFEATDP